MWQHFQNTGKRIKVKVIINDILKGYIKAGMAELVDAVDSKSTECMLMGVQVPLSADI